MRRIGFNFGLLLAAFVALSPVAIAATPSIEQITADRSIGKATAPVTMIEYASLTCSHCAEFAKDTLPVLEKNLVETGKLKIIYRDFPLDGLALKAAAVARCLPEAQYFPFIKMLFARQATWAIDPQPEVALARLASLAGLSPETAQACMSDTKILDALSQKRLDAEKQFKIQATPTFIFNNGAETVSGAAKPEKFIAVVEKLAAEKK